MNRAVISILGLILSLPLVGCDSTEDSSEPGPPPQVRILSPANGATISDTTGITVDGVDHAGQALDRIVYYVDDQAAYTDPNPSAASPASVWQMPTETYDDGPHTIRVTGYDRDGQSSADNRTYVVSNVDAVSGLVSSDQSGSLVTSGGARVTVPVGAVPRYEDDSPATTVFSIERDTETAVLPPADEGLVSNVYRFGPSGFVFALPVQVTIPILEGVEPNVVSLYRINPTTGAHEYFAGDYDEATRTVTGQTYQLSSWFLTNSNPSTEGPGLIRVNNLSGGGLTLCVSGLSLAYPQRDALHVPELNWMSHWSAADGEVGLLREGNWWLPQGTYTVCLQTTMPDGSVERETRSIDITAAADRTWGAAPDPLLTITDLDDRTVIPGECPCVPEPTIPVGTGEIQATLQWFNPLPIDLDLWIYEPDGERCYFANPLTPNGGELDRDNLCANYQNGTPENIFYTNPPPGEYSVWVHWWSDCGNGQSSQDFEVRLVIPTGTTTYDRTILPDDTVEVIRFTIGASGIASFRPPIPDREWESDLTPGGSKPDLQALKRGIQTRLIRR